MALLYCVVYILMLDLGVDNNFWAARLHDRHDVLSIKKVSCTGSFVRLFEPKSVGHGKGFLACSYCVTFCYSVVAPFEHG
jgi:hypothetical protein